PGEKLHEVLVSSDEAHHTLEFDDMFVILPLHPWWKMEHWTGGKALTEGFLYSSKTNSEALSVERLREMVAQFQVAPLEELTPLPSR
ncbi:MAG TPA: hypothetical protein DD714_04770, partial [Candidatus Omnitrophica bacterium]|nr:hypothetical protein [Candidatus Omnitrophota bacterium]